LLTGFKQAAGSGIRRAIGPIFWNPKCPAQIVSFG
jgi:hypothetical protein